MSKELIEQARATIDGYHRRCAHPSFEYVASIEKPEGDGWELNLAILSTTGDLVQWRRRKMKVTNVQS